MLGRSQAWHQLTPNLLTTSQREGTALIQSAERCWTEGVDINMLALSMVLLWKMASK
jgi:hypothetical protein